MTATLVTSQSEVNMFRSCRHRWGLRYLEGLIPRDEARAPRRGRAVHVGAAAAYEPLIGVHEIGASDADLMTASNAASDIASLAVKRHFADEWGVSSEGELRSIVDEDRRSLLDETLDTTRRLVERFLLADLRRYDILAVEQRFDVPVRDVNGSASLRVWQIGAIDLVLRERDSSEIVVNEWKTSSTDCSSMDARLDVDPQTPGYLCALRERYGSRYSYGRVALSCVRAKGMSVPHVNKIRFGELPEGFEKTRFEQLRDAEAADGANRGLLSHADVDCDRETYERGLAEQQGRLGVGPTEGQLRRLDQLPRSQDRWAARHEWFYTPAELDRWRGDYLADARLMRRARRGLLPLTRNGASCAPQYAMPCSHRAVCVQDGPEVRERLYEVNLARGGAR